MKEYAHKLGSFDGLEEARDVVRYCAIVDKPQCSMRSNNTSNRYDMSMFRTPVIH